jgi:signal transduction histidine kinase
MVYLWLFVLTAGTLLSFFWMVAILGHRRRRTLERILFFVCLALCLIYGGALLAVNASFHFHPVPRLLALFTSAIIGVGLVSVPSLALHLHVEYASARGNIKTPLVKRVWLAGAYAPLLYFLPLLLKRIFTWVPRVALLQADWIGSAFWVWLAVALAACAVWQYRFSRVALARHEARFHREAAVGLFVVAAVAVWMSPWPRAGSASGYEAPIVLVAVFAAPCVLAALLRNVSKTSFLRIDRQRNLILALSVTFVALLYLSFIRRVSQWLDLYLPPEATAALLLFLPVVFFEPLQRKFRGMLRRVAHGEVDRAQKTMRPIQQVARLGDSAQLTRFIEDRVREQFQLASVRLQLAGDFAIAESLPPTYSGSVDEFPIRQSGQAMGVLRVESLGAMLSGETYAAIELVCEQLPGAFDLCRLIEEKLRLEKQLAERERLAALGHMAASVSHNLKNPLGAIKTILQLQLENPKMPESLRPETAMVLNEINRLSAKLNQLMRFSRPAFVGAAADATCDLNTVVTEVIAPLRAGAQLRGITIEESFAEEGPYAAVNREALHDIVSNLASNAMEALPAGGRICLRSGMNNGCAQFEIEDDGPGFPKAHRAKIFQPFFTTKPHGTGLGLAIVARRVAECRGKIAWQSPVANGRGTRFTVRLPAGKDRE